MFKDAVDELADDCGEEKGICIGFREGERSGGRCTARGLGEAEPDRQAF